MEISRHGYRRHDHVGNIGAAMMDINDTATGDAIVWGS